MNTNDNRNKECEKVHIDGDFIVFTHDNGFEYDPSIDNCRDPHWIWHMREKMWFTPDIEQKAKKILNDYWALNNVDQKII